MIRKLVNTVIFTISITQLIAQEANIDLVVEKPVSRQELLNDLIPVIPNIESILYNEQVHKKQKSGKMIQATGFREGSATHFNIHFLKQRLHGEWKSFYENNQTCDSGSFKKDLPDGEWKTWYPNGQIKTLRTYNAKKYNYIQADLKRNHPKDQRYQITRFARSGKNVKRYFRPVYNISLIQYYIPILEKIKVNTSGGENYIAPFSHCLHHGVFINYAENGLVKDSGSYSNGVKQDLWKESTANNEKAFGFYHSGLRHGQWKYYDAEGRLIYTETFKHGKKTSSYYFKKKSGAN